MPSISLDCEPASAHSTRTSPAPPCSRGHSPPQTPAAAAAAAQLSVVSHSANQPTRFSAYNQTPTSGFLTTPLEQYRLQLYNYAVHMERFRCPPYTAGGQQLLPPSAAAAVAAFGYSNVAAAAAAAAAVGNGGAGNSPYAPGSRLALSMSLFPQRIFQPEEPKPQHSYIGLIAMAILSSVETKLVLSDIYQYILDNYPYFRTRGPGWRNSIRHNLSLNDCFVKSGRSANGKGHYWAIHPANMEDFRKGDFRRRKAQRKVRKHMGLSVDDEGTDSPSPPPLAVTPPPSHHLQHYSHHLSPTHTHLGYLQQHHQQQQQQHPHHASSFHQHHQHYGQSFVAAAAAAAAAAAVASATTPTSAHYISAADVSLQAPHNACNNQLSIIKETTTTTASVIANLYSQTRKRQFDVASLLAPDVEVDVVDDSETIERATGGAAATTTTTTTMKRTLIAKLSVQQHHHHHHHHMTPYASKQHAQAQLTTQQQLQQNLSELDEQEDIDVVASDVEDDIEGDADEIDEVVEDLEEEEEEEQLTLLDKQHDNEYIEPDQVQEENNNSKTDNRNQTPESLSLESSRPIEEVLPQKQQQQQQHQQQYEQNQSNESKVAVSPTEPTTNADCRNSSPSGYSNSDSNNSQHQSAAPQKQQQQHQPNLQRLMHQLPNELSHVDPRIFGCYYGTYMAAAAAQQVVARRISFPLTATTPTATPQTTTPSIPAQQHLQHHQQQQQLHHQQQQHNQHTQQLQQLQLPQQ